MNAAAADLRSLAVRVQRQCRRRRRACPARRRGQRGGANSQAFKYNETSPPRVIGVPTGWCPSSGGFKIVDSQLEPFASRAITLAVERLVVACLEFPASVNVIAYSSDQRDPTNECLGSSIFTLAPAICDFIVTRLRSVPSRMASNDTKFTLSRIAELEEPIRPSCSKSWLSRGNA